MFVPMAVGFAGRIVRTMGVLMVFIVIMKMFMLHRFVAVPVLVMFCQMQPNAGCH